MRIIIMGPQGAGKGTQAAKLEEETGATHIETVDLVLDEINEKIDRVIVLEADDEELIERLSGRRQSEATGEVYHIEHNPPPEEGSEKDPGPFVQRDDDTEEAIRNRLNSYHEETEPLKDIDEVTQEVLKAVGENK